MTHGNNKLARLARPHAERAILGLAAIIDDGTQSAEARLAAVRVLLERAGAAYAECRGDEARLAAVRVLLELAHGRPVNPPRAEPTTAIRPRLVQVEWGATK